MTATSRVGQALARPHPRGLAGLRDTQREIAALGDLPDLVVLGPDEIHKEIGSDFYHGGMVDPLGAGLHVGKFVNGLPSAAIAAGATICENAPVVSLDRVAGRHLVQTTRGQVLADDVLIATSGYTVRPCPLAAAATHTRRQLHHLH